MAFALHTVCVFIIARLLDQTDERLWRDHQCPMANGIEIPRHKFGSQDQKGKK